MNEMKEKISMLSKQPISIIDDDKPVNISSSSTTVSTTAAASTSSTSLSKNEIKSKERKNIDKKSNNNSNKHNTFQSQTMSTSPLLHSKDKNTEESIKGILLEDDNDYISNENEKPLTPDLSYPISSSSPIPTTATTTTAGTTLSSPIDDDTMKEEVVVEEEDDDNNDYNDNDNERVKTESGSSGGLLNELNKDSIPLKPTNVNDNIYISDKQQVLNNDGLPPECIYIYIYLFILLL